MLASVYPELVQNTGCGLTKSEISPILASAFVHFYRLREFPVRSYKGRSGRREPNLLFFMIQCQSAAGFQRIASGIVPDIDLDTLSLKRKPESERAQLFRQGRPEV